ncbi:S1 family peptidase [Neptunicella sp. SCSIO 80796]|uniref:S1 family peptidase n=1 Tax=Neptunicella plasticusilytica TaxID=3117012 RepID=UPI003A4DFDD0
MADNIVELVKQIKPSVVGIGTYNPLGSPRSNLQGTGFAIGDGTLIATNFHVVEKELEIETNETRVVFIGQGSDPKLAPAEIIATDPAHDIAILRIKEKVQPLTLSEDKFIDDGLEVAFTGFPIGAILGLYPATHKGLIAALTPVVIPSSNAGQLSIEMMKRLRDPFFVYQMDATAFPGNSGSPVYDTTSGKVVAIINKVFIQKTKEAAITDPSGISYSIPVRHLRALAKSISVNI